MNQKTIPKKGYGFKTAYYQLTRSQQILLRSELSKNLQISRPMFYRRMSGIIPSHPDYLVIKEVFQKYGIEKPFDYENESDESGE